MTNTNTFTTIAELVAELNTAVDLVVPAGRVSDYPRLHNAVIGGTKEILAKHGLEIPSCWFVRTDSNYPVPHNCEQVPLGYVLVDLVLDKGQKTSRRGRHQGVRFAAEGPQDLPVQAWIHWANVQRLEAGRDDLAASITKTEEILERKRAERLAALRSIEIEWAEMERIQLEAREASGETESDTRPVTADWMEDGEGELELTGMTAGRIAEMITEWQEDDTAMFGVACDLLLGIRTWLQWLQGPDEYGPLRQAPAAETQIVLNLLAMIRDWQTDDNDSLTKAMNAGTVFLEVKEYLEQRLLDRHQEDLPAPGCDICGEERLPGRSFCRRCWELEHSDPEYPEAAEK